MTDDPKSGWQAWFRQSGIIQRACGYVMLGLSLLVGLPSAAVLVLSCFAGIWLPFAVWLAAIVGVLVSPPLFRVGRDMSTPSALRILARDKRQPILLLRSFGVDRTGIERTSVLGMFGSIIQQAVGENATLEETIAEELRDFGPTVAIGRPNESVPPAGFGRMWLPDSEWQTRVEELLLRCQIVVVLLGGTGEHMENTGFAWELDRVFKAVPPEKILFAISPNGHGCWREVADIADEELEVQIEDTTRLIALKNDWSIRQFDADGEIESRIFSTVHNALMADFNDESYRFALENYLATQSDRLVRKSLRRRLFQACVVGSMALVLAGFVVHPLLDLKSATVRLIVLVIAFLIGAISGFLARRFV